jgi:hypothetical protein
MKARLSTQRLIQEFEMGAIFLLYITYPFLSPLHLTSSLSEQVNVLQSYYRIIVLHNRHARSQLRTSTAVASVEAKNIEQICRFMPAPEMSCLIIFFPMSESEVKRTSHQASLHEICTILCAPAHIAFSLEAGNHK